MEAMLQGRVAFITGAARGIGKGIALKYAQHGASIVLVGRNEKALEETAKEIQDQGGETYCVTADVTNNDQVLTAVEKAIAHFGKIDILVNNAGISKEMPLMEMPIEVFDEIMTTNMRSVMLVTKAILPHMVENGYGRIINIGSGAALRGLPGSVAYSASKAAVVCFTQALGDEIRKVNQNVRINAICPGPVDTELFQKSERREFILQAGGDVFSTETVADGALFLASEMSKGVNSQVLVMRGFNRW